MLDIALGYHRMQFQRKRMIQTQENDKETHFGLIYARWSQIRSIRHFFQYSGFISRYISLSAIILYNIRKT